ncbi:hypothetical protein GCM10027610_093620 [Dactylosporangium cerinum]
MLYFFSIGSVKGFAFALGVATILDLVVVFLFRHPIMTLFARSKAFLSPRVSGLGRIVEQRQSTGVAPSAPVVTARRRSDDERHRWHRSPALPW